MVEAGLDNSHAFSFVGGYNRFYFPWLFLYGTTGKNYCSAKEFENILV